MGHDAVAEEPELVAALEVGHGGDWPVGRPIIHSRKVGLRVVPPLGPVVVGTGAARLVMCS